MGKIFFFAMLMVLTGTGCAQNTMMNYGRALTPSESAPPPVSTSPRDKSVNREVKWYEGLGWHWTRPGQRLPR